MVLLLQAIGACMYSSAYPYSRLCVGLSGLLGSGGKGNLFSGMYGELDSGGGGVREQGFDEHILAQLTRAFVFATRIVQFLFYSVYPKLQASSFIL